jgi:hypothetical protein
MKFLVKAMIALLPLLISAPAVQANDLFETADEHFEKREDNRAEIAKARTAYMALLSQVSGDDLVYAVAQLGRLAIYEGEMLLPKTDRDERREIFQQCWCTDPSVSILGGGSCRSPGFVEKIKTVNGQEHPAYFYFKGVCMAYWGEQGSTIEKLAFVGTIESLINKAPTVDYNLIKGTDYEGGGAHRLAAGFYANPGAAVIGYYKPDIALAAIDRAIAAPAAIGDPSNGSQYFDNHQGRVTVLIQLHKKYPNAGWNQKGIDYANQMLLNMTDIIDFDTYPAGRKAEFMFNYKMLKTHYKTLTGQDWAP